MLATALTSAALAGQIAVIFYTAQELQIANDAGRYILAVGTLLLLAAYAQMNLTDNLKLGSQAKAEPTVPEIAAAELIVKAIVESSKSEQHRSELGQTGDPYSDILDQASKMGAAASKQRRYRYSAGNGTGDGTRL